jgi:hypothetical protein
MILSLFTVSTTFPSDRLLVPCGLGAMGLLAQVIHRIVFSESPDGILSWKRGFFRGVAVLLIVIHLVFAPLALPVRAWSPAWLGDSLYRAAGAFPFDDSLKQQDAIMVNGPCAYLGGFFIPVLKGLEGKPTPAHTRVLTSGIYPVELTRTGPKTLLARIDRGLLAHVGDSTTSKGPFINPGYAFQQMDRTFRDQNHPFALGEKIELKGLTMEIVALTDDGRPREVLFHFAVPLEDPSLRWFQWVGERYVPFKPPSVGQSARLPAPARFL